jgi:hypothetical protein
MVDAIRPQFARRLLEAAVWEGGAVASSVSGGIPRPQLFVDGQPWTILEEVFREIHEICVQQLDTRVSIPL